MNWRLGLVFALLLLLPAGLLAQASPSLLADWRRDRTNVLAYIEAMPESAMTYRPSPGVRTFAQQIDHIVATNVEVAATALLGETRPPTLGDSTQYLHRKAALRAYASAAYDYVLGAMARASAAQWNRRGPLFGQPPEVPARWLELSHEHSVWTLGQVVPYLRLNGVTPPSYQMPF